MTEWSIDAKSMASVKKQVDQIAATSLTVQQVFATIGRRLEPEIRQGLNQHFILKNTSSEHAGKIAGNGGLLSVVCKPTGRARFSVTIKPKLRKGEMLMTGRKGSGFIRPKRGKALSGEARSGPRTPSHKFSGKASKRVRSVSVPGRSDEIHDLAEAIVQTRTRHLIAQRTGLGPMGGKGTFGQGRLK
jgi:hypothetical protein